MNTTLLFSATTNEKWLQLACCLETSRRNDTRWRHNVRGTTRANEWRASVLRHFLNVTMERKTSSACNVAMDGGDVICVVYDVTGLFTVKLCTVSTGYLRTLRISLLFLAIAWERRNSILDTGSRPMLPPGIDRVEPSLQRTSEDLE